MAASVTLPADGNAIRAFILETVMTFTLVYVVLVTTTSKNYKIAPLAGVAIGFTLGFNVILGGSISGGSLNPARSFGPALIVGNFDFQWIYWIAPILGGLIAAGVYKGLHKDLDLPSPKAEQINKVNGRSFCCKVLISCSHFPRFSGDRIQIAKWNLE